MTLIYTILVIGIIATFHEFGHFLVAKQQKIPVKELSIGVGPKIIQKRIKETNFSIRMIPIFAYVQMAGAMPDEQDMPNGFLQAKPWTKAKILMAGSGMNILLAILIFMILFMGVGVYTDQSVVGNILEGSPAQIAGLISGDQIISIDGQDVDTWTSMTQLIDGGENEALSMNVMREDDILTLFVRPIFDQEAQRQLIGIEPIRVRLNPFRAIWQGVVQSFMFIIMMIQGLYTMVIGSAPAEISGPVGIAKMIGSASASGFASLLNFTAILSLNIAIINMLPIPGLDGGKLVLVLVEKIRGKRLSLEKEATINLIGLALLIGIMVLATYKDIMKLFGE